MLKIFYTDIENIDKETKRVINEELVYSKESIEDDLEEGQEVISRWELTDWKEMQVRAKNQKLDAINEWYEAEYAKLTYGIPEAEIKTWLKQEIEAEAYVADNSVSTPLIDRIAENRGVDRVLLIDKILIKAPLFNEAIGVLTGKRQKMEDELYNA